MIIIVILARITCISLDEKIATGSLLRILRIFPWLKIASQGNMHNKHWTAPLNSYAKVVYIRIMKVMGFWHKHTTAKPA